MSWITAALIAVPAVLVALYVRSRARYYGQLFAEEHLRELQIGFAELVQAASAAADPEGERPCALVSSRGLVIAVTERRAGDQAVLHVSISQEGGRTTQAVASRVAFVLLATLAGDPIEVSPFYTQSRVFHVVVVHRQAALGLRAADEVLAEYGRAYRPIPFVYRALPGA